MKTTELTGPDAAHAYLFEHHPRDRYAHDVVDGRQNLSGSDLKGAAKRYGGSYKSGRERAASAIDWAGGHIRQDRRTGRLTVGWDDIPDDASDGWCSLGLCYRY